MNKAGWITGKELFSSVEARVRIFIIHEFDWFVKGSCRRSCVVPKIKFRNRNKGHSRPLILGRWPPFHNKFVL